jgi:hypothetical protein
VSYYLGTVAATVTLEVSQSSRCLPSEETRAKRKVVVDLEARHDDAMFQQALHRGSAPKKNRTGASLKYKAKNILADFEAGASRDLPPQIRSSFLER